MKPTVTWVLVANGNKARIFEHAGQKNGLSELEDLEQEITPLNAGDIESDRRGRSFDSGSEGRSAMEPQTDPVDKREADFVTEVLTRLDEKRAGGAFDRLIIAAAPQALGDIRKAMSEHLSATVSDELDKDLTNVPAPDMAKHFSDVLPV